MSLYDAMCREDIGYVVVVWADVSGFSNLSEDLATKVLCCAFLDDHSL